MSATFEEKLLAVKNLYKTKEDLIDLQNIHIRFGKLKAKKEWLDHPTTTQLREIVLEQINNISTVLLHEKDMDELKRHELFAEREAHLLYLSLLVDDPSDEIKTMEEKLDYELKNQ